MPVTLGEGQGRWGQCGRWLAEGEDEQSWFSFLLAATKIEGRANVLSDSLDKMQG